MELRINFASGVPIYLQLMEQIKHAVETGAIRAAEQLPTIRKVAEELAMNPNTVARAYGDLLRDGLIESRAGRGVFITRKRKVFTREEGWRRLEPLIDAAIGEAMAMDFTHGELREAFEKKLGQWKPVKGGNRNDE